MFRIIYRNISPKLSKNIRATRVPIKRYALPISSRPMSQVTSTPVRESTEFKSKIMNYLYKNNQRPIPTTEKNVILTNCPHCYKVRKNSFAAYLDLQKGTYNCKTCKTRGSFNEFSKTLSKKVNHPESGYSILSASGMLSNAEASTALTRSPEEISNYAETLINNAEKLEEFESKHKITRETLEKYGVGVTDAHDKPCLSFPQTALMYDNNDFKSDTVRLKLCEENDLSKVVEMDPPVSGKENTSGLFGYQTASEKDDTVILTRRELDAMAAYQTTGIPAFSIPTSNHQLQESVLPLLERFNQVYIWLDDDVDGQIAAERFARRIGEHKCLLVRTRQGDQDGPLNAYDALHESKDLKKILSAASGVKHDQIVDFRDLREEIYNEILHPDQTKGVQSKDLPALNEIMKGHRPGELTILTGPTGAGKTTVISQLSLDYCKAGVPTLWGSFEIINRRLAKKMLYQFAEKDISSAPEEFGAIAEKFEQLPLYFLKFFSSTAIKDVLKACHHAVYAYDVRHIILDNLQFMLSQQAGNGLDKWDIQDNAIAEIRKFATQQDVHITLVVHPRKDSGNQEELDIHSIFGSAKVTQEADNVIIIQKTQGNKRYLDIKKNRFDGTLGTIPYKFDRTTNKIRQYTEEELKKSARRPIDMRSTTSIVKSKNSLN